MGTARARVTGDAERLHALANTVLALQGLRSLADIARTAADGALTVLDADRAVVPRHEGKCVARPPGGGVIGSASAFPARIAEDLEALGRLPSLSPVVA
jgi:hypothetical protein